METKSNSKTETIFLKKEIKKLSKEIEHLKGKLETLSYRDKIHIAFYDNESDFYFKNNIGQSLQIRYNIDAKHLQK